MDVFKLMREWFEFCFDNPEKINPTHSAIYFFCIEHCNRLGWKEKFGLPTEMTKEAIGVRSYKTYSRALNDLIDFGFIIMIQKSKNQYSSNIIALVKNTKAPTKALTKAVSKHASKQVQSTVSINIPNTIIPNTAGFKKPTHTDVQHYCKERQNNVDAQRFINFYESKGWMIGKNKMKDWKAAVRTWEEKTPQRRVGKFRNTGC